MWIGGSRADAHRPCHDIWPRLSPFPRPKSTYLPLARIIRAGIIAGRRRLPITAVHPPLPRLAPTASQHWSTRMPLMTRAHASRKPIRECLHPFRPCAPGCPGLADPTACGGLFQSSLHAGLSERVSLALPNTAGIGQAPIGEFPRKPTDAFLFPASRSPKVSPCLRSPSPGQMSQMIGRETATHDAAGRPARKGISTDPGTPCIDRAAKARPCALQNPAGRPP